MVRPVNSVPQTNFFPSAKQSYAPVLPRDLSSITLDHSYCLDVLQWILNGILRLFCCQEPEVPMDDLATVSLSFNRNEGAQILSKLKKQFERVQMPAPEKMASAFSTQIARVLQNAEPDTQITFKSYPLEDGRFHFSLQWKGESLQMTSYEEELFFLKNKWTEGTDEDGSLQTLEYSREILPTDSINGELLPLTNDSLSATSSTIQNAISSQFPTQQPMGNFLHGLLPDIISSNHDSKLIFFRITTERPKTITLEWKGTSLKERYETTAQHTQFTSNFTFTPSPVNNPDILIGVNRLNLMRPQQ